MTDSGLSFYQALAPMYDHLTAGDDYEALGQSLANVLAPVTTGPRLLDVATGTGRSAEIWRRLGYQVIGCDLSFEMLRSANVKRSLAGIPLAACDMRRLPFLSSRFDVVTCVDDAVNHLGDEADLLASFSEARRVLAPGGVYLFDVNSAAAYAWFDEEHVLRHDDSLFVWRGRPAAEPGKHCAEVIALRRTPGGWQGTEGTLTETYFDLKLLRRCLGRAGLTVLGAYGWRDGGLVLSGSEEVGPKTYWVTRVAT